MLVDDVSCVRMCASLPGPADSRLLTALWCVALGLDVACREVPERVVALQ